MGDLGIEIANKISGPERHTWRDGMYWAQWSKRHGNPMHQWNSSWFKLSPRYSKVAPWGQVEPVDILVYSLSETLVLGPQILLKSEVSQDAV